MQNIQEYEIPFKGVLKFTPIDSPLVGQSYSVNLEDLIKSQNEENIYSIALDNWYDKFFNNVKRYQRTVSLLSEMTPELFTESLRTITLNFGRKSGASTSIADFINKHPNLNIKVITVLYNIQLEIQNKITLKDPSKYFDLYDIPSQDVDIVFIDNASLFKPKEDQIEFLAKLNSNYNRNQWIIKLDN